MGIPRNPGMMKKREKEKLKNYTLVHYMLKVGAYVPESSGFTRYLALPGAYAPESVAHRLF